MLEKKLEAKYGLPHEVIFCKRCVMSNQRPTSSVEFKHKLGSGHKTLNIDDGDDYANEVRLALTSVLGSNAHVEMQVVPRGKKFTKVTATMTVDSASVISSIYDNLEALDATVMKF